MYDIKIINGRVVDFDNNKLLDVDIGIKNGKIIKIGKIYEDAKNLIDACNNVVSPGFIDIHMHEEDLGSSGSYEIANNMCLMGVTTAHGGNCGINSNNIEKFINYIKENKSPINYMLSIGYNSLREMVGINDHYIEASSEEKIEIKKLINKYLNLGACGISFGIEYSPGITKEEMIEACKDLNTDNILLSAHFRADGEDAIESIKEMATISKETNLPMQISHLGSCSAVGVMKESLEIIEKYIDEGVDIGVDCYPYDACSTYIGSEVFTEGCFERWNKDYDCIFFTEGQYKGQKCTKEIFEAVRKNNPDMLIVAFLMNEDEVAMCLKSPFVMLGSDGVYKDSKGHPRGAGSFPRLFSRFVRERKDLELIEALKKSTIMPAKRLSLSSKGEIKEKMDADIVIFNEDTISDKANFENPTLPPTGIKCVIINGEVAVENGEIINNKLGVFIDNNKK